LQKQKILNASIIFAAAITSVLFLVLFFCVRCEPDDMTVAVPFRTSTIFEILHTRYCRESFRPIYPIISFFALGYTDNTGVYPYSIFATYTCLWLLFVFIIYKLLKEIFVSAEDDHKKILLISFSQLLFTALYFLTTSKVEIFGFFSATIIHMVPVIFMFISAFFLIRKKVKKTDYIFLFVSAFFVAGGSDQIGGTVLGVMMIIGAIIFIDKNKNEIYTNNKPVFLKGCFFGIVLAAFFLLFVTNPGILKHHQYEQSLLTRENAFTQTQITKAIQLFFTPWKIFGFLFLLVTWLLFFKTFQTRSFDKIKLRYFIIPAVFVFLVTGATCWMAYKNFTVGRLWFVADAAFFVLFSTAIIKYFHPLKNNDKILWMGLSTIIIAMIVFNTIHIPRLIYFASEADKRIEYLQQQEANKIVVLPPLPDPDLASQAFLSEDPNFDSNIQFCEFYQIKAKVSIKK
jgi:hypothetical protein